MYHLWQSLLVFNHSFPGFCVRWRRFASDWKAVFILTWKNFRCGVSVLNFSHVKKKADSSCRLNLLLSLPFRGSVGKWSPEPRRGGVCVGIGVPGPSLHPVSAALSPGGALTRGHDCGFKGKEGEWGGDLGQNRFFLFLFQMCGRPKPGWGSAAALPCSRWDRVCPDGSSVCSDWLRTVPRSKKFPLSEMQTCIILKQKKLAPEQPRGPAARSKSRWPSLTLLCSSGPLQLKYP